MIKSLKYLIVFLISLEIILRIIGFGDPVIYNVTDNNYYPKKNQELRRFKGKMLNINHLGMRTNYKWKNYTNKKKILFFGDSVSFAGSYIDNKNIFSEKVCDRLAGNSICGNYGVNGYLLENLSYRLQEVEGSLYDELVIIISHSFSIGKTNFKSLPIYNYKLNSFSKASFEIMNHILFKYKILDRYHKNKFKNTISNSTENQSNQLNIFINHLEGLSIDKKVSIFLIPTMENLNNITDYNHFLDKISYKNINYNNLFPYFKKIKYEELYYNNAHLNEKGHEYLSKIIYDSIK